jgi:two-component system, response regulator PdtaR
MEFLRAGADEASAAERNNISRVSLRPVMGFDSCTFGARGDGVLEEACGGAMSALLHCTVLVVEDEGLIRLWIAEVLMEAGFQVIQASSGDEALKVLQRAVEVDLLMTDIRMPGSLDGLELVERVRATWPTLKIVILTSEHLPTINDARADAFISKPFHPEDIVTCLKQLMGVQNDTR